MKKVLYMLLYGTLLLSILALTACSGGESSGAGTDDPGKITVYTSIYPVYDFAAKIGGDKINLHMMVPSGTEPHDWEPKPKDMARLQEADVFIYNGAGMESWVDKVLNSIDNEKLIAVEASDGIKLMENPYESDEHEDDGGHEHKNDPHVWLDPMRAKKQMENIMEALSKADADNADYYEDNYMKYSMELEKLDEEYRDTLEKCRNRDIIVTHPAFGYLCDAYDLNQIAIGSIGSESEPSSARMAEITNFARENDIKIIFFEETTGNKLAKTIADEVGGETMTLSTLERLSDEDIKSGKDYFSVMTDNLKALEKALR